MNGNVSKRAISKFQCIEVVVEIGITRVNFTNLECNRVQKSVLDLLCTVINVAKTSIPENNNDYRKNVDFESISSNKKQPRHRQMYGDKKIP